MYIYNIYICLYIYMYIYMDIKIYIFIYILTIYKLFFKDFGRRVWRASEWRYLQSIFTNPTFLQRFRKASMASERVEILCNLFLQIQLIFKDLGRRVWRASEWRYLLSIFTNLQRFGKWRYLQSIFTNPTFL